MKARRPFCAPRYAAQLVLRRLRARGATWAGGKAPQHVVSRLGKRQNIHMKARPPPAPQPGLLLALRPCALTREFLVTTDKRTAQRATAVWLLGAAPKHCKAGGMLPNQAPVQLSKPAKFRLKQQQLQTRMVSDFGGCGDLLTGWGAGCVRYTAQSKAVCGAPAEHKKLSNAGQLSCNRQRTS